MPQLTLVGAEFLEPVQRHAAERDARDSAGQGENHTLDQQLADDGAAIAAECHAGRDLTRARAGTRQQESRDVDAADHEDHQHRAPGEQQLLARVARNAFLQGRDALFEILHFARESRVVAQRGAERAQLIIGSGPGDAGRQAGDHLIVRASAFAVARRAQGRPNVHRRGGAET